jgi:rare lipoprotein A
MASFIADRLDGRRTASGETYNKKDLVAAHQSLPFGTMLRVTNPENGRVVVVKVIDRNAPGANRPILDLSRAAAERLDIVQRGVAQVTIEILKR